MRGLAYCAIPVACLAVMYPVTSTAAASDDTVTVSHEDHRWQLDNGILSFQLEFSASGPRLIQVSSRETGENLISAPAQVLRLERRDQEVWQAQVLEPQGAPSSRPIKVNPSAQRVDDRFSGYRVEQRFAVRNSNLQLVWWAELREHAHFLVTGVQVVAPESPSQMYRLILFEASLPQARVNGSVSGSPIVAGRWFLGCEHPMADNEVTDSQVQCAVTLWPVPAASQRTYSFAIGFSSGGQMRRDFLRYLERRRARPYGLFVNYNSWWDIADGGKLMTEAECLAVIECFGEELTRKRGVTLDSFVFDDGWDDPRTLWDFHDRFPEGFSRLRARAASYQSAIGTWLSPFGGYGAAKEARLAYGRQQGYEVADYGFSLAGKNYYARFAEICRSMVEKFDVNYFKFDGIAGNNASGAGEKFAADVEALLRLCQDLRRLKPELYLSITTGTWPSPYWLWFGDSVWRNGEDCGVMGWGTPRQRWITYRDAMVKQMIVDRAPLYPLNSLMTIPVCFASRGLVVRLGVDAETSPDLDDLRDEMWMGFASGTQLAELYVTPQRLSSPAWDTLAECIRWARDLQPVLVDTHWIGGDPEKGEVYGYAAWQNRRAVLILRNPADQPREFVFTLRDVWELPPTETAAYNLVCRYARRLDPQDLRLNPDQSHRLVLPPWGIILWEGQPSAD